MRMRMMWMVHRRQIRIGWWCMTMRMGGGRGGGGGGRWGEWWRGKGQHVQNPIRHGLRWVWCAGGGTCGRVGIRVGIGVGIGVWGTPRMSVRRISCMHHPRGHGRYRVGGGGGGGGGVRGERGRVAGQRIVVGIFKLGIDRVIDLGGGTCGRWKKRTNNHRNIKMWTCGHGDSQCVCVCVCVCV
jgi:hypothetical protein